MQNLKRLKNASHWILSAQEWIYWNIRAKMEWQTPVAKCQDMANSGAPEVK